MKPLVADALWERLQPLLPPAPQRRLRFPGRKPLGYRKIPPVSCSSSRPTSPGTTCPLNSAVAAARPAGTTSGAGIRPMCGGNCTPCCWPNSTAPTQSIGSGRSSTPPSPRPPKAARTPAQPDGSQQIRQQTPRPDRRPRHPAGGDGNRRQRQQGHLGLTSLDRPRSGGRQTRPEAPEGGALARGPGRRLRTGASCCAGWASRPFSPSGTPSMAAAWGSSVGSWSGRSPGCMRSGGRVVALTGSPRFKKRSSV
jgi:hypothetical protein